MTNWYDSIVTDVVNAIDTVYAKKENSYTKSEIDTLIGDAIEIINGSGNE